MGFGKLIIFEGPDGSGKTTQLGIAGKHYEELGYRVLRTKEPGCPYIPRCIEIRKILQDPRIKKTPLQELDLFLEDRLLHTNYIKRFLEDEYLVLSDRRDYSTKAYQCFGGNIGLGFFEKRNKKSIKNVFPNLVLFYDVCYETAMKRIFLGKREELTWFEQKGKEFFDKVREGYLFQFKNQKSPKVIHMIDAEPPIEKVWEKTLSVIEQELSLKEL